MWDIYNARVHKGESIRVFPLSNWTELDIWQYIRLENIPIVPLYFAKERPCVEIDGNLIMADDDRLPVFNVAAHVVAYAMFAIYVIPIILVIVYSFCDSLTIKTGNLTLNSFTLANYQKLFTSAEAIKPYLVSIVYSLLAAVLAVLMAVICARADRDRRTQPYPGVR